MIYNSKGKLLTLFFFLNVYLLNVFQDDAGSGAGLGASSASVNRYIQQLAQEYSGDCKTSFDELSKIIQVGKTHPCDTSRENNPYNTTLY